METLLHQGVGLLLQRFLPPQVRQQTRQRHWLLHQHPDCRPACSGHFVVNGLSQRTFETNSTPAAWQRCSGGNWWTASAAQEVSGRAHVSGDLGYGQASGVCWSSDTAG